MISKKFYFLAVNIPEVEKARREGGEVWRHVLALESREGDHVWTPQGEGWRCYIYATRRARDAQAMQWLKGPEKAAD